MATSLHQQLKSQYVDDEQRHEIRMDGYRIDAIDARGRLIEVQCAPLSAIRDKIRILTESYRVIVVKPLAARKKIITLSSPDGDIVSARYSPVRQKLAHAFLDLVHFAVFPSKRLQLDLVLTEQQEIRVPPHDRSSWKKKYSVADRLLVNVQETVSLRTGEDLWNAIFSKELSPGSEFTTAELAETGSMPRWLAQKAAFCFRRMGLLTVCGKRGNAILYERTKGRPRRRKTPKAA